MMVQIDIAERRWTDIAIEYITSGVGFKTKPVDPAAPDGAVEIMRAPTGDHIVLTSSGWKDLASSISQYLNATPNAVTPGVSVIEKWLKSYGELPDRLHQSKLVEMSYEVPIGKLTRPVTCIAVSRPWASEILSTTDINVCSVAQDLWNKGGNLVLADGRWVIPYSPVGEATSNADFAAHIASLDKNDAIVLDPDMVYRIEELTATDATTTDYVKKAKEIIAGRNHVRLGKTSLQKNCDALVGVKRAKFRGEHYPALAFMTATQVLALKSLPVDNPTRPSNAVVHPTEQGRYCTAKTLASAVIINPAFVKKATEMQGATRQALDSKMAEALDGYCQAMGPGDAAYLKKRAASDVGWPIAVSPTKDQAFIEIPVRDPAESRGIVTQDPNYGRGGHDPDVWVPKNAAKEDKTKTVRCPRPRLPLAARPTPTDFRPPAGLLISASTSTTLATSRRPPSRRAQTWAPSSTGTFGAAESTAASRTGSSSRRGSGTGSRRTTRHRRTTATVQASWCTAATAATWKSTATGPSRSRRPDLVPPRNGRARPTRGRGGSGRGRESRGLPQY